MFYIYFNLLSGGKDEHKRKIFLLIAVLLFIISVTTSNISAQENSEGALFKLEDITVTARKIEENLQDTPIAVTALQAMIWKPDRFSVPIDWIRLHPTCNSPITATWPVINRHRSYLSGVSAR